MTTAIIGVGHIGSTLAQHLVGASEEVALGALDRSEPEALAEKLGPLACGDSVERAIARADTVIFAVWLEQMKELIAQHKRGLEGIYATDDNVAAAAAERLIRAAGFEPLKAGGRRCRNPARDAGR